MSAPINALDGRVVIHVGECREVLRTMPEESVHCVVTSPPYFGLRDYGADGQIGLEQTPDNYVAALVEVFREVRRVLRKDGTVWLNLGDSYANDGKWGGHTGGKHAKALHCSPIGRNKKYTGLKPKDLIGIPWRVAFALQADGWWLRQEIIWKKPNPMPESVDSRCTRSHEQIFMLAKSGRPTIWQARDTSEWSGNPDHSELLPAPTDDDPDATVARWRGRDYYYDADAIRESESVPDWDNGSRIFGGTNKNGANIQHGERTTGRLATPRKRGRPPRHAPYESSDQSGLDAVERGGGRNARSVWSIATRPFPEAHFATFPPDLPERCIKAGCPDDGTVLDPFGGAGTTGLVAARLGRRATLIELNPDYAEMARLRIEADWMGEASRAALMAEAKGIPAIEESPLFGAMGGTDGG